MTDIDDNVKEMLSDVRKVGAKYEEHQQEVGLDIPVDLVHFKKFPVIDPPGTYKKEGHDTRSDIAPDDSLELPDYSGPFNRDLRFSDFSNEALVNMLRMSDEYYRVCIEGWADSVAKRYGREEMLRIQSEAWQTMILPQLQGMIGEWMELTDDEAEALITGTQNEVAAQLAADRVVLCNPYRPESEWAEYSKGRLVKMALGSHEYLLAAIESWALAIVMRDGLDEMFDFQWALWSETLLPAAKDIKSRWMSISGDTVEAFMKDIQVDATSFPGKAFELTFEMPDEEVGIFTFNKMHFRRPMGSNGSPRHRREGGSYLVSRRHYRDGQDVQPEHEGRNLGHSTACGQRRCLLQVATVDSRRIRSRIRAH
jgi:hypothetical protein